MNRKKIFSIFITLVCSVTLIGVSYWYVNNKGEHNGNDGAADEEAAFTEKLNEVRSISLNDHILGNPDASIVFYVYSDFSCPYCKQYHETLRTLFSLYGDSGEIAYVFRHMPVVQLHPNAPMYALASECVAKTGGPSAFWKFTDMMFDQVDPVNPFTAERLVSMAQTVGVNTQAFVSCMRANELMTDVQEDYEEAVSVGADGTPFTVVQTTDRRSVLQGAQPFKTLAYVLKTTLGSLDGADTSGTIKAEDFDSFSTDRNASTTATTSTTIEATATSSSQPSILDGIIE